MKYGTECLDSISQKIIEGELRHKDSVIIGDNSCGKSELLKVLINKNGIKENIYFIDAINRGFDVSKIIEGNRTHEYKNSILSKRIQDDYFNLQDSFNCYDTSVERIEEMYGWLEEKVQDFFEQLTGDRFSINSDSILGEVEFKGGKGKLSSGYQAIVRLLMELSYYQKKCVTEKQICSVMVIIDELDEFLSPGYAYKIFPFLKENFPMMDFIVTTHSCDLVAGAQDANLIILDNNGYEVLDINDYQSVSEVQIIFDRVFGSHLCEVTEVEEILRRMFNNKLNNAWTKQDQERLLQIQKENLSASQQLIYKQIMEW